MKMTNLIAAVVAVSGAMVVLGGILNSASVVAIFSGVVGQQDGGWYGIVALLLAARPRNGWLVKMEPEAVGDHRFSPLRAVASPLPEHGPSCWE